MFAPALPALSRVRDGKIGHNLSMAIDDDDIMVIVRPVEASIVSNFLPEMVFPRKSGRGERSWLLVSLDGDFGFENDY
jgi:hypothetical protein